MCQPFCVRIVLSIVYLFKWNLNKADLKSAFLQTEEIQREVFVISPRESTDRLDYWLLLTAAYGFVDANVKWKDHSDILITSIGLRQVIFVPQRFFNMRGNRLCLIVAKIVDDIIIIL